MKQLNEDIRSGQFHKVYLLFGDEDFLICSYRARLKQAVCGDDEMNYASFEGKQADPAQIMSLADTVPFFAEKRLIQIIDSGWLKKEGKAFASYLEQMPESTVICFSEHEVDKRNAVYKQIVKLGYAAELKKQTPAQLGRWAAGILQKSGIRVTQQVMDSFLDRTGDDMNRIRNELDKLITYLGDRDVVREEDLEAVCSPQITGRIFDMISAISRRDRRTAMDLYQDLLRLREPPMRILALIARQYRQLLLVKDLSADVNDRNTIAARAGISPYAAGRLQTAARAYRWEELRASEEACLRADEAIKSGDLKDQLAVELLIMELSTKAGLGRA